MTQLRLVSDCMTRDVVILPPTQEINSALHVLLKNRVSGAPVVDERGALVGILTEKDCLRAALEASYYRDWGRGVDRYMSRKVVTMAPGTDIVSACQVILESPYRRFPVVANGRLRGLVSRTDILRALADNWGER